MSRVNGEDIKMKLQCHNMIHTLTNPLYTMTVSAEHRSKSAETSKGNSDFSKRCLRGNEKEQHTSKHINSLHKSSFRFTFPFHFKKKTYTLELPLPM